MIAATDKRWNSATTLYIARKLQAIAGGRRIAVLDMGCGDGTVLEQLLNYGYDLYGYDLSPRHEALQHRLGMYFGDRYQDRIRLTEDERAIPFDDESFDVVYANQVFEHVQFFDRMMAECARVLKPKGILLTNFPLATCPVEWHLKIPFAHWIPPGPKRVRYLRLYYALGLRPKGKGRSPLQEAIAQDGYLRDQTYYRFMNEVSNVARHYFERCNLDTDALVRAKLDMMGAQSGRASWWAGLAIRLLGRDRTECAVTHLFNAAFSIMRPRRAGSSETYATSMRDQGRHDHLPA